MDGLNLALHLAYNSNSFEEAIKKAVSWGGDSDTNAAMLG
jgi:ADP-ribosylglycohydrolase